MKVNKLFKGDKVVMHDCMEAHSRENVWKWLGEEILDSDIARFVSFIG